MHPAWRAALIASAASDAAPRAEFAVPPRSRAAAITGAASGVETTAASAFRPRTVRLLPWILVCPNPAPSLACPYTRFCIESMSMNASTPAPGSSGAADASRVSSRRPTASSWRTLPQVNERRNDPSVDGARIPPNTSVMAPCRRTSMSSMLSAPAAMPATRPGIFRCGFTPAGLVIVTCSPARSARPHRCARAMTGTRPARDTRFGSSNDACVLAGSCDNRTCEVSSRSGLWQLQ